MTEMSGREVFDALSDRLTEHEKSVELRFERAQTAMTRLRTTVQRRIDALDDRIDEIRKDVEQRNDS
jgi:hypothetical protein